MDSFLFAWMLTDQTPEAKSPWQRGSFRFSCRTLCMSPVVNARGVCYMPFWLAVVLGFLIVARTTRFVNSDVLAEPLRMWADGIERPGSRARGLKRALRKPLRAVFGDDLPILFTCPWCLSIWFALPVAIIAVVLTWPYPHPWFAVLGLWLGYSYVYGLAANTLDA